jgi:3-methyl-2-oxobutanoate hydroxymethyltransferase
MSVQDRPNRLSVTQVRSRKGGNKLVCLTAYTSSVARLLDNEVDLLLVGDSLAMVVYGFDSTLPTSLDMMIAHGAAVVRSTKRALVVVDLPFGSYQASPADAFRAAARVLAETGCTAVKLEGGEEMVETVAFLTARGVLGLFNEFRPKFVKRYRSLGDEIRAAAREYAEEVRAGRFPAAEHTYSTPR